MQSARLIKSKTIHRKKEFATQNNQLLFVSTSIIRRADSEANFLFRLELPTGDSGMIGNEMESENLLFAYTVQGLKQVTPKRHQMQMQLVYQKLFNG
ncbi:MAG: hypothetical protein SFU91_03390 [Chloroherpetonaceae bacterium]|nr:hypothetical protein [Chloroherpetonaceae bacterium]